jgi:hypothetical protein
MNMEIIFLRYKTKQLERYFELNKIGNVSGGTATVSEGQKIRIFEHFANERV